MKQLPLPYPCHDWARQIVLILYTIEASLCLCTSLVIYINGLQLGEGVRKENLVMDGRLTTHIVQGERNWYALWLCGAVGRVMSVIVFPLICIYMQKGVAAHWIYQMCQRFVLMRLLSFQGLISYSGWSRIWILKIKVKELTQSNTWSWTEVFHPCLERHEAKIQCELQETGAWYELLALCKLSQSCRFQQVQSMPTDQQTCGIKTVAQYFFYLKGTLSW